MKFRFIRHGMIFLALLLAGLGVFGAGDALALGLGEIRVKSSYNTSFRAVVPIFLDHGDVAPQAEIGHQDDYTLLQVGRPPFIDKLVIAVEDDPDKPGAKIAVVTSKEPISQPSFNLIIRASAGGGAVLENYFLAVDFRKSLSLDLPEPEAKKPEAAKPVAPAPAPLPDLPPVPVIAMPEMAKPPVETASAQPAVPEPPAPAPKPVEPAETAVPAPKPDETVPLPAAQVVVEQPKHEEPEAPREKPEAKKPEAAKPVAPAPELPPQQVKPDETPKVRALPPHSAKPLVVATDKGAAPAADVPTLVPLDKKPSNNTVRVKKGDTLFNIARSLNAAPADLARAVVAIYLANRESFIGPNIHLMRKGATLDYRKVNEIAATLTADEARAILDKDWKAWKDPHGTLEAEMPVERAVSAQEILDFVENWKKHWMTKSAALAEDYSDDFRGPNGAGKEAWMASKGEMSEANTNINLSTGNVKMARQGASIAVSFAQTLRSDQFFSSGLKTLVLKPAPAGLKITDERFKAEKWEDLRRMWSLTVASYSTGTMAAAHVRNLVSRGVPAFEQGTNPDAAPHVVLAGRFTSRAAADDYGTKLLGMGEHNLKVVRFPFSIRLGVYDTREQAASAAAKLVKAGYAPFQSESVVDGLARFAVYLGAFATKEDAAEALGGLKVEGFSPVAAIP